MHRDELLWYKQPVLRAIVKSMKEVSTVDEGKKHALTQWEKRLAELTKSLEELEKNTTATSKLGSPEDMEHGAMCEFLKNEILMAKHQIEIHKR